MNEIENEKIIEANIAYHSALAETYDKEQPYFKQENVEKVDALLKALAVEVGGNSLIDFGCGTGFILNIAKKYFKQVVGVDITQQMLDRVDKSSGNIELYRSDTANTPLKSGCFDVCTAYGFLHHLRDLKPTFTEAYRLLREGGVFYADLEPNYYYWDMIKNIRKCKVGDEIIMREIQSVLDKVDEISNQFNLDKKIIMLAEYQKIVKGGFKEEDITQLLHEVGFTSIDFRYEWYLGQAYYLHNEPERGAIIESYLRRFLPAARHLFKYVSFVAKK